MFKKKGNFIININQTNNYFTAPESTDKHYVVYRTGAAGEECLRNGRFGNYKGDKYSLSDAIIISKQLDASYKFVGSDY